MSHLFDFLNLLVVHRLGWVLLHSLWQGAVAAIVLLGFRSAVRGRSADVGYWGACFVLFVLALAPCVTFFLCAGSANATGQVELAISSIWTDQSAGHGGGRISPLIPGFNPLGVLRSVSGIMERGAPWVVMAWALGVVVFSCRWVQGSRCVRRIRTAGTETVDEGWLWVLETLRLRMGISRPVGLLKSALVQVPVVVGWLKPVILLPPSALSGLTPEQLEAVIAHELAHVWRHDYLVNAFQNLVETVMFYHPAVWWISNCIREERENCCDDVAVQFCGDRTHYARALFTLETARHVPRLAFAASGGSLLQRIRRLLGASGPEPGAGAGELVGSALLGMGCLVVLLGVLTSLAPVAYQARALIRVEPDAPNHLESREPGHYTGAYDPYFVQTELVVINSDRVLGQAVEDLDLRRSWGKRYGQGRDLSAAEAARLLRTRLELRPVRITSLIEIRAKDQEAAESARLANAVARAYFDLRGRDRSRLAMEATKTLESSLSAQDAWVAEAQAAVDKLRIELKIPDAVAVENAADGINTLPRMMTAETLRRFESLRIESQAEYTRQKTLLEQLRDLPPNEVAQAIPTSGVQDGLIISLVEQQNATEQKLIAAQKEFGPQHTEVVRLSSQLEDLRNRVRERENGILIGLSARVRSLKKGVEEIETRVREAIQTDLEFAERARPFERARQELDDRRRLRQALLTKLSAERTEAGATLGPMLAIVEEAEPPAWPISPNRARAAVLLAGGLVLVLAGVWLIRSGRARVVALALA